jgi:hypothetical protein
MQFITRRRLIRGHIDDLGGQVTALVSQRNELRGEVGSPPSLGNAAAVADPVLVAVRKPRRAKFLIVGNMRTGSTWLETLLGALPDVATEFELKWRPPYTPHAVHLVLETDSPTVEQILEELDSDLPVVGSKFILDPYYFSPLQFRSVQEKLSPEIRIVHLTRNPRSIFLSRRRGIYHDLNRASTARISVRLKAAIVEAGIDKARVRPSPGRIAASDCYDELATYVGNDVRLAQLARSHRHYLLVDYGEIAKRMTEIARFVGSEAGPDVSTAVIEQSPTVKLPPVEPEHLVTNVSELAPLFEHFEALRQRLTENWRAAA